MSGELLKVDDLHTHFAVGGTFLGTGGHVVRAVDGVGFGIAKGEVLGLVGESGSGKSTIGKTILRLLQPTSGRIEFAGQDITHLPRKALRPFRRRMQLVFQDPFASLNPRQTVGQILSLPLQVHEPGLGRAERRARVEGILDLVGLSASYASRFPHEFSGGQRQRIGIARSLVVEPEFLVADEPVSALDVSIQAQIVNLLLAVQARMALTILFITHDLAVVGHIADRVAVMYLGRLVELAPTRALFSNPRHPYTEALFRAAPIPDPTLRRPRLTLKGELPSPLAPPSGCVFRTRCPYTEPRCAEAPPPLRNVGPAHLSACIRDDLTLAPAPTH
ncbi:MAG: oligopeptide/dipeptide ABC transporter ATP-binding protein [Geminicoccaceae bacterium]